MVRRRLPRGTILPPTRVKPWLIVSADASGISDKLISASRIALRRAQSVLDRGRCLDIFEVEDLLISCGFSHRYDTNLSRGFRVGDDNNEVPNHAYYYAYCQEVSGWIPVLAMIKVA